jgi:predicted O-linked N-acetylglucosamine transferase (SPINDLY family)
VCEKNQAAVLYMPSVGMNLVTIFTASLRFAPLQLTALGHGASTQSPWVDYFAVDEDFVGDQSTFSEKIIALPVDAMPIVASSALDREALTPNIIEKPDVVKIAIAATTMKVNPLYLETLRLIAEKSPQKNSI